MSSLSRRHRRSLERARHQIITTSTPDDVAIVHEDGRVTVLHGDLAPSTLAALGLAELVEAIAARRAVHEPHWIPTVVIVDAMASLTWTETRQLSRGGVA